jgi:acyl carrier protein
MTEPASDWIRALALAARPERSRMLEGLVLSQFRVALLMSEVDVLPMDESYWALGLTSLGAVEIEQRLEAELGRAIDTASVLNSPTVDALLAYLRGEVLADLFLDDGDPGAVAAPAVAGVPRSMLDDLLKDLYDS